nr:MAG TPA: DNA methylase [Caudoviricetes sp.]
MKVLIACEESQEVCKAFRARGHEAYSCDIQEPSGGHLEWHVKGNVLPLLNGKCSFTTQDGVDHKIEDRCDLIIAHPPCTYLTVTGNRWFDTGKYGKAAWDRMTERNKAIGFFTVL